MEDRYMDQVRKPRKGEDIHVLLEVCKDIIDLVKEKAGEEGLAKLYELTGEEPGLLRYGTMIPSDVANRFRMGAARVLFPYVPLNFGLVKVGEAHVERVFAKSYSKMLINRYVLGLAGKIAGENAVAKNYLKTFCRRSMELTPEKGKFEAVFLDDTHAKVIISEIFMLPEYYKGIVKRGLELLGYLARVEINTASQRENYVELIVEWQKRLGAAKAAG